MSNIHRRFAKFKDLGSLRSACALTIVSGLCAFVFWPNSPLDEPTNTAANAPVKPSTAALISPDLRGENEPATPLVAAQTTPQQASQTSADITIEQALEEIISAGEEHAVELLDKTSTDTSDSETEPKQDSVNALQKLPECDSADAYTVTQVKDLRLSLLNSKRVICFAPGDYRSANVLTLKGSGSAEKPRVLRSLQPADSENRFDPKSDKVILPPIIFIGASHWAVDGIDWEGSAFASIKVIDSQHIRISNNHFKTPKKAIVVHGSSSEIYIQDNWVQASSTSRGHCLSIDSNHSSAKFRVTGNQLNNCQSGLRLSNTKGKVTFLIAENDINRTYQSDCGVAAITINAEAPENKTNKVIDNRLVGWQNTKPCTDTPTALALHSTTRSLNVTRNIFKLNSQAVSIASGSRKILLKDNIIAHNAINANQPYHVAAITVAQNTSGTQVKNNHIVASERWLLTHSPTLNLSCNIVLKGGTASGISLAENSANDNSYFDSNPNNVSALDGSDTFYSHPDSAKMDRLCFETNQLANSSESCIDNALLSAQSPEICGSSYWSN